jgi:hypothetical protein
LDFGEEEKMKANMKSKFAQKFSKRWIEHART